MPAVGFALVAVSSVLLLIWMVQQYRREGNARRLALQLVGLALYGGVIFYFFGTPRDLVPLSSKGPGELASENAKFLAQATALYAFTVFGMAAEWFYSWFDKPKNKRRKPDVGGALKPFFISPILLVPTLGAFQGANIDLLHLGVPSMMILLGAFEKGFLWRHYFAKTADEAKKGDGKNEDGAK